MIFSVKSCVCFLGVLVFTVFSFTLSAQAPPSDSAPDELLIVFVDSSGAELPGEELLGAGAGLQGRFVEDTLPELEALAEELGVALRVFDVAEGGGGGSPAGVGLTPAIVFQNWRGRWVYQGRYETLDRVKNFVRTARFMDPGEGVLVREGAAVWDRGRMKMATPIKVTAFTGPGREAFVGEGSEARARAVASIINGMKKFSWVERVELGRSDRQWYTDYHPYVAADGTLYVGAELYSQFHCHDPVASWLGEPVSGPWEKRAEVFAEAAARTEREIVRLLSASELGDGFEVVTTAEKSWEALGFVLPDAPVKQGGNGDLAAGVELAAEWVVDAGAQEDRPAVQFSFGAPLDAWRGEATKVWGTVALGDGLALGGASGRFDADPASVTMGEADLDDAIHNGMLDVEKHPASFFVFDRVDVDEAFAGKAVAFGVIVPAVLHGEFTMAGETIPLSVPMSVEAFVGEDGRARLSLSGAWSVDLLGDFGIEGPDGPEELRHVLRYGCWIVLEPGGARIPGAANVDAIEREEGGEAGTADFADDAD